MKSYKRLTDPGTREYKSDTTISKVCERLSDYEDSGLSPEQAIEMQVQCTQVNKSFALACRSYADYFGCPSVATGEVFMGCNKKTDKCEVTEFWKCWQRYFNEKTKIKQFAVFVAAPSLMHVMVVATGLNLICVVNVLASNSQNKT